MVSSRLADPPHATGKVGLRILRTLLKEKSLLTTLQVMQEELGDVFRITLPGFSPVVLVGPQAMEFTLVAARNDLRWRAEHDPVTNLLRQGVLVTDGDWHDQLRRQMNPALHRRMLSGYARIMWQGTDQVVATWRQAGRHDMLVEMRRIALIILMQSLFTVDISPDMDRLWSSVIRLLEYISPGLWLINRHIPRPGYRRAREQIDSYLYQIIKARRAQPGKADDLLGLLVTTPGMNDDLIRDQMLTMLIAGHDTSTALLAWALYLLGRHPEVLARLQTEVDTVLGADPPTADRVSELVYLDQVVKETLRLYPPIHLGMRIAAIDLQYQGYRIPAGTRVLYSIYLTHRHKHYWSNPHCFDPDRFSTERSRNRLHYTYMPFGGGSRNCIGFAFANLEAKVVLARLLQRVELKLVSPRVYPHMGATLEPRPGVRMAVWPRLETLPSILGTGSGTPCRSSCRK